VVFLCFATNIQLSFNTFIFQIHPDFPSRCPDKILCSPLHSFGRLYATSILITFHLLKLQTSTLRVISAHILLKFTETVALVISPFLPAKDRCVWFFISYDYLYCRVFRCKSPLCLLHCRVTPKLKKFTSS
jgi:hypothetical protein